MSAINTFLRLLNHPVKARLFLFLKLPSAFFSGVRIRQANEEECKVTVPFKWFSQNPFRSTYFACLSMAGEMSTGALAMSHVYKRQPAISMLVTHTEGLYFKKATEVTTFVCRDGRAIKETIERAIATGEAQTIVARSEGTNKKGEPVATFLITWSFKVKNR